MKDKKILKLYYLHCRLKANPRLSKDGILLLNSDLFLRRERYKQLKVKCLKLFEKLKFSQAYQQLEIAKQHLLYPKDQI